MKRSINGFDIDWVGNDRIEVRRDRASLAIGTSESTDHSCGSDTLRREDPTAAARGVSSSLSPPLASMSEREFPHSTQS